MNLQELTEEELKLLWENVNLEAVKVQYSNKPDLDRLKALTDLKSKIYRAFLKLESTKAAPNS